MATGFSRSVSLPNSNPPSCSGRSEKSFHVRSTSLPCRSHPLVSQVEHELRACRAWRSTTEPRSSGAGMSRLELLHLALGDLLQLPQTRDALRRRSSTGGRPSENLLEDFLHFADAYGSFRSALVALQELQLAAQVAVRRRDKACLASVARSLRKAAKEIATLSSALSNVCKSAEPSSTIAAAEDAELAGILREVKAVTVAVSTVVFRATAAALASTMAAVASSSSAASWTALKRRLPLTSSTSTKKKGSSVGTDHKEEAWARTASERLDGLEEEIIGLESGSERVLRALMNTRVSLLNIMTPPTKYILH